MNSAYQFTSDWFSAHKPIWNQLINQFGPSRILEIGSYEGRSTCYLIEFCGKDRPVDIYCVDSWEGGAGYDPSVTMSDVEQRFDSNIAIAARQSANPVNIFKLKKRSNLALAELLSEYRGPTFDLIYIDGSHEATDVMTDAVMAFPLLHVGGLLVFDDYLWQMGPTEQKDTLRAPKLGIDAFVNLFARKLNIFQAPLYQLYTQKVAE
jgi:predicted O-methyltransferase YrrM